MKIRILGGDSMLGHKVFERLQKRFGTYVTFRASEDFCIQHQKLYEPLPRQTG